MLLHLSGNNVELLNNGAPAVPSQPLVGLTSVVINGANGVNNTLTVDFSVGVFAVSGGIAFNNTPSVTDVDTLIVNGTTGADTVSIGAASLTLDSSAISFSGLAGLQVNTLGGGDNVTVTGLDPTVATTVDAGTGAGPNAFNLNVAAAYSGNLTTLHFDHVTGTVGGDFSGSWSVQGSGTIDGLTIGGTLTASGMVVAQDVTNMMVTGNVAGTIKASVPTGASGTGTIAMLTINGSIAGTGMVMGKNLGTVHVVTDLNGEVIAQGSGTIGDLNVGGSIGPSGMVMSEDVTNIMVMGDVAGAVTVTSNALGEGNLNTMIIGGNFLGTIFVQNLLTTLTITGASTGTITTGSVNTISATAAIAGSPVLTITQGGVLRTLVATRADNGNPTPTSVKFAYLYDGALAIPQISVRVTNGSPTTSADDVRFDLRLITSNAGKFNLGLFFANGTSDLRDLDVEGDVVATVDPKALAFFGLPSGTSGGVKVPLDNLGAVAAQGNVTAGTVHVASLQAVAFGSITAGGVTTPGQSATNVDAAGLLAAGSTTVLANDTYFVPFAEGQPVAFFLNTGSSVFDAKDVLFTDQIVDNKSVTATVTAVNGVITKITLTGNGGSISTSQPITQSITSTGPLGDLTISNINGVPNVTAPSIFGNIDTNGPVFGIVQTTVGDLGSPIRDSSGTIVDTTIIHTTQGITGEIISRGNLVSQVQSQKEITGVIATQGDLGVAFVNGTGQLVRFGGLLSQGQFSGDLVVLGNALGDLLLANGISGRIAVKGRAIPGLASTRIGILGNLLVSGNVRSTAAIVSAGLIGDAAGGTSFSSGAVKGILAAEGTINISSVGTTSAGTIIPKATGENKKAIDAIFTEGGLPLAFDLVPGSLDLGGLALILNDLNALHVGTDGNLTGPMP
jgi:hypothetical protein